MREFLLKMYAYLKRLSGEQGLDAAIAVALAMIGRDDRLAIRTRIVPGGLQANELPEDLLAEGGNPAVALGAALAMQAQEEGCVVVTPVSGEQTQSEAFHVVLALAAERRLPIVFLTECGREYADELEDQAEQGEVERIQADGIDAMRLMPVLRLAIDKAREGDGPTLIECICEAADGEDGPAARLADVLITEGYATPEELI